MKSTLAMLTLVSLLPPNSRALYAVSKRVLKVFAKKPYGSFRLCNPLKIDYDLESWLDTKRLSMEPAKCPNITSCLGFHAQNAQ